MKLIIGTETMRQLIIFICGLKDEFRNKFTFTPQTGASMNHGDSVSQILHKQSDEIQRIIAGSEIDFLADVIRSVRGYYTGLEASKKIEELNRRLKRDFIRYDGLDFVKFGGFAEIKEIEVDGKKRVEKKLLDNKYKSEFEREKSIMYDLYEQKREAVVKVYPETLDTVFDYFHWKAWILICENT